MGAGPKTSFPLEQGIIEEEHLMKKKRLIRLHLPFVMAALVGCGGVSVAQQTKVPREVWRTVQEKGVARVIVLLNMQWESEGNLTKDEVSLQRRAIILAKNRLLSQLTGTTHKLVREYTASPGIVLEVGPDALAVLESSADVNRVDLDRSGGPAKGKLLQERAA